MEQKEQTRVEQEAVSNQQISRQRQELDNTKMQSRENKEQANNLKSAFAADRHMLQQKINELEDKLKNRIREVQSLEQKIHMLCQQENSNKNELNFWNGKVATLKRDLEYQQTFAENV